MDDKGLRALEHRSIYAEPPTALERWHISEPMYTGIRAIDSFLTVGKGQRVESLPVLGSVNP